MSTSWAGRRNLEVRIENVLLDGVEATDRRVIVSALEAALVDVFTEEDAGHLARDRSLDRVVVREGPPPRNDADLGVRAARSIFRGITE